jgi:hypothetical protein
MAARAARAVRMIRIKLKMDEASFQAFWRFSFTSKLVNVGIKAEPSAPPATRLKSVSESRLAAINASIGAEVPKALATRIWRMRLTILLSTYAAVTRLAARAIWLFAEGGEGFSEWFFTILDYIITHPLVLPANRPAS